MNETSPQLDRPLVGTAEDLHASAARMTGNTDFGDPADDRYTEGLDVLLHSLQNEAGLTTAGSKSFRSFLRGALAARTLSEAGWAAAPETADTVIERPIFVTGLPRTGTTALHRLLHADPRNQGLELWLCEYPQTRPPRDQWEANPIYTAMRDAYKSYMDSNPEYAGIHYISADDIEECWQLLRQSFASVSHECLAHVPSYSRWLDSWDWTPAYRRHRRNLQLIGAAETNKRWVLKNPSHMFALDELFEVYPDALVVQTHRDPKKVIGSICSLAAATSSQWSTVFQGAQIGRDQLDTWQRGLEHCKRSRQKSDNGQIMDVYYDELVADPVATVESIYDNFGIESDSAALEAIKNEHTNSLSGVRKPSHSYSLEQFGLSEAMVDEAFEGYTGRR